MAGHRGLPFPAPVHTPTSQRLRSKLVEAVQAKLPLLRVVEPMLEEADRGLVAMLEDREGFRPEGPLPLGPPDCPPHIDETRVRLQLILALPPNIDDSGRLRQKFVELRFLRKLI